MGKIPTGMVDKTIGNKNTIIPSPDLGPMIDLTKTRKNNPPIELTKKYDNIIAPNHLPNSVFILICRFVTKLIIDSAKEGSSLQRILAL